MIPPRVREQASKEHTDTRGVNVCQVETGKVGDSWNGALTGE